MLHGSGEAEHKISFLLAHLFCIFFLLSSRVVSLLQYVAVTADFHHHQHTSKFTAMHTSPWVGSSPVAISRDFSTTYQLFLSTSSPSLALAPVPGLLAVSPL